MVGVGILEDRGLAAGMIMTRIRTSKVVDMIMALVKDRDSMVGVVLQGRVRLGDDSYLLKFVTFSGDRIQGHYIYPLHF